MKKIFLTKGSASGSTEIVAYCNALKEAGLFNMNLIRLSSVLPHNSEIIRRKPAFSYEDYGKKVYVIISEAKTSKKGKTACAVLGWIKEERGSGHGIVLEMQGKKEVEVMDNLKKSLVEVAKDRKEGYKDVELVTESITCEKEPVCAIVALVFNPADEN
jgi:arginine decarboxylase